MATGRINDDQPVSELATAIDTRRLESFSDGIMAVIITLMAFQLKAPLSDHFKALENRLPELLVYILSFTVIGIYWNNHHHLFRITMRIDARVMWMNLSLMFWLSLVPFATQWVGNSHDNRWPAATYGVVAIGSALAFYALTRAILHANSGDQQLRSAVGYNIKGVISPFIFVLGIGLSFVSAYLAYACYALVSVMWFVPDRRLARRPAVSLPIENPPTLPTDV